jgi:EpsI family protein
MRTTLWSWAPAGLLLFGSALTYGGVQRQVALPLRAPLETALPSAFEGMPSRDVKVSRAEQRVAGMDDYVMRVFAPAGAAASAIAASVYVGYYERQSQGHSIHSPKNCLPGSGWEPLTSSVATIPSSLGTLSVNRYLIANGSNRALVLYWYQGRGRVTASEYAVKWNLLRDQAVRGRSDEALVRIIVPVTAGEGEEAAFQRARRMAQAIAPAVARALPA